MRRTDRRRGPLPSTLLAAACLACTACAGSVHELTTPATAVLQEVGRCAQLRDTIAAETHDARLDPDAAELREAAFLLYDDALHVERTWTAEYYLQQGFDASIREAEALQSRREQLAARYRAHRAGP